MNELGPNEEPVTDGDVPRPLGVGVETTGHEPVDAQLRLLARTGTLAVPGHLQVYENVHSGLRDVLAALDRPRS